MTGRWVFLWGWWWVAVATAWDLPSFQIGMSEPEFLALVGVSADGPTPVIASLHRLGLANRLRHLAAAALFAEDHGAPLRVRWAPDGGCNATLGDLFATDRAPFSEFEGSDRAVRELLRLTNATSHAAVAWPRGSWRW